MNTKSPTHVSTAFVPEECKDIFTENKKYRVEKVREKAVWIKDDKGDDALVKFKKGGLLSQFCHYLGEGRLWTPHYEE